MATVEFLNFRVSLLGSNNLVYANDRQQITVVIEGQKRVGGFNGVNVPLNQTELGSLTLVERGGSTLPPNWSVDTVQNSFDGGMWRRSLIDSPDDLIEDYEGAHNSAEGDGTSAVEVFRRYVRVRLPAQERQFMATIVIEGLGRVNSAGSGGADSWITITPVPPYSLSAPDLQNVRENAHERSHYKGHRGQVDVFYWHMPMGLRIMSDHTISIPGGWSRIPGLWFFYDSGRRLSARITLNVGALSVGQIRQDSSHNHYNVVLHNGVRSIRALICYNNFHNENVRVETFTSFEIIDNFGCGHNFVLRMVGNNDIRLSNN